MEWIPSQPHDLDVEAVSREIVNLARDVTLERDKTFPILEVRFKSFEHAKRVTKCLNERYLGIYARHIDISLAH